MAIRVIISGPLSGASVLLKSYLIETKRFDVDIVESLRESVYDTLSKDYQVAIFCYERCTPDFFKALHQLRAMDCKLHFLLTIKRIYPEDADQLGDISGTNIVKFPVSQSGFLHIVDSMVNHLEVKQRRHPRFYVEIKVQLSREGVTWPGMLRNFSLGGAAIELQGGTDLVPGDPVDVKLMDPDKNLFSTLTGKVVWTAPVQGKSLKRLVGLELSTFLKEKLASA